MAVVISDPDDAQNQGAGSNRRRTVRVGLKLAGGIRTAKQQIEKITRSCAG